MSIEPSHGLLTVAIPEDVEERFKTHLTPLDTWSLTGQHFIPSLAHSMFTFKEWWTHFSYKVGTMLSRVLITIFGRLLTLVLKLLVNDIQ